MSHPRAAHLHGQEILLVWQDAVGVDVFLEPVAAGRESGCWGLGGVPPSTCTAPAALKGYPLLIQSDPYLTNTHSEELQYHYCPWHAMS